MYSVVPSIGYTRACLLVYVFLLSVVVYDSYCQYNFIEKQEAQRGIRSRQVDTNVVAVTFDTLSGPAGVHTGDVVVCNNEECTAVLSHLSKVSGGSDFDQKVRNI